MERSLRRRMMLWWIRSQMTKTSWNPWLAQMRKLCMWARKLTTSTRKLSKPIGKWIDQCLTEVSCSKGHPSPSWGTLWTQVITIKSRQTRWISRGRPSWIAKITLSSQWMIQVLWSLQPRDSIENQVHPFRVPEQVIAYQTRNLKSLKLWNLQRIIKTTILVLDKVRC